MESWEDFTEKFLDYFNEKENKRQTSTNKVKSECSVKDVT